MLISLNRHSSKETLALKTNWKPLRHGVTQSTAHQTVDWPVSTPRLQSIRPLWRVSGAEFSGNQRFWVHGPVDAEPVAHATGANSCGVLVVLWLGDWDLCG